MAGYSYVAMYVARLCMLGCQLSLHTIYCRQRRRNVVNLAEAI